MNIDQDFKQNELWSLENIQKEDIPKIKGLYAYISKDDNSIQYIGSSVAKNGLRTRIWSQHLNEKYLEPRIPKKATPEDKAQLEKGHSNPIRMFDPFHWTSF